MDLINRNDKIEIILSGNGDDEYGIKPDLHERLCNRFGDFPPEKIIIDWNSNQKERYKLNLSPRKDAGLDKFELKNGPNGRYLIEKEINDFFADRDNI